MLDVKDGAPPELKTERFYASTTLPMPKSIEGGGYVPWREACRGFDRPSFHFSKKDAPNISGSFLNLRIEQLTRLPSDTALRLLAWAERLVRELEMVPSDFDFSEHAVSRTLGLAADPERPLTIAIYIDVKG